MIKTIHILVISMSIYSVSSAQKIKSAEIDKFTGQRRVQSEELLILNTKLKWPHLYISFRSVDTACFITLHGENIAVGVVGSTDIAWLLLDDNSKITIHSTGLQSYDIGSSYKSYRHQYRISLEDIGRLTKK